MTHDSIFWYGSFNYFLRCLAQWELPLWDPYSFSGTPFFLEYNGQALLDPTVLLCVPLIWLGNFSTLDLFHWHYGALLFIYYAGAYTLALHLAKNKWAALLGATLLLFVIGGNGFRQHGIWSSAVYSPWILLFLLQLVAPRTSPANRKVFFLASCYLIGLSLNIYIPSYIFIFLSLAFLYLCLSYQVRKSRRFFSRNDFNSAWFWAASAFIFVGSFFLIGIAVLQGSSLVKLIAVPMLLGIIVFLTAKLPLVRKIFSDIGLKSVLAGFALFTILTAPFFYSLSQVIPGDAENFGYARANPDASFNELAHLENNALLRPDDAFRIGPDSLMGVLFPFPDVRYFMGGRAMQEVDPVLGLVPLLIILLFFRRAVSPYKGLCLFLVVALGLIVAGPDSLYDSLLIYFPALRTIRVVFDFLGFFYVIWVSLFSMCFASLFDDDTFKKGSVRLSLGLGIIGFFHIEAIYFYLTTFSPAQIDKPYLKHVQWLEENLLSHSWLFAGIYGLVLVLVLSRFRSVRVVCACSLAALSVFQVVELCVALKLFTIQPALYSDKGDVHYNQKFAYKPIRVPVAPRMGTFYSYLPALYRLPVAGPLYTADSLILGRRNYDYLRFTLPSNLALVSAVGAQRYGFFDQYFVARSSVSALMLVNGLPKEILKNTLVLEEREFVHSSNGLRSVRLSELPPVNLPGTNPEGSLVTLYTDFTNIDFLNMHPPNGNELYRNIAIPEKHPLLNWPWDEAHLGYFLVMTRHLNLTPHYRVLGTSTFMPVSLNADGKGSICFSLFQQNGLFEDRDPRRSLAEQYPYYCAMKIRDGALVINETYWANVTNKGTFNRSALAPAYPGVTLWALDPVKVTPDHSPYVRDEPTEVLDFGPNHIRFKIDNSKAGLFYYADTYSKHWTAQVDGEHAPILRANFNFKAVYVDKGEHIVEFRFEPSLFIIFFIAFIFVSIPGMVFPVRAALTTNRNQP